MGFDQAQEIKAAREEKRDKFNFYILSLRRRPRACSVDSNPNASLSNVFQLSFPIGLTSLSGSYQPFRHANRHCVIHKLCPFR
jgi:hypothetical protein